jgi:hypothetical protein
MNEESKQAVEVVKSTLETLVAQATNETIRAKLRNLHDVCHHLIVNGRQRLSVPTVIQAYAARIHAKEHSLAEPSIRNKRGGANPYQALYRAWEGASEIILTPRKVVGGASPSDILGDGDMARLDPALRHRINLLIAQNRSLKAQVDILRDVRKAPVIHLAGAAAPERLPATEDLVLNDPEVDALRDFVAARKLKSRGLRRTDDGGVETMEGRRMADPGFMDAVEKIVRSYQLP